MLTIPFLAILLAASPAEPPAINVPASATASRLETLPDYDRWYSVELMGGKAGWMHTQQQKKGDQIVSRTKMTLKMGRGAAPIEITMASEFVESLDGKPVSMRSQNKLGGSPVETRWTFKGDKVEVETKQQGRVSTETHDAPKGEWLTPAAAERDMLAKFRAGAKEITATTVTPDTGLDLVSQTRTGFTEDSVTVDDKPVKGLKTTVTTDAMGGVTSTEWLDSEGELIKSETNMGGLAVVMTRTSKALAQEEGDGPSPEIMVKTFVKPDKPIEDPRHATRAVYVLSVEGDGFPDLPSAGAQRVEKLTDRSARVTIDASKSLPADASDATNPVFQASTVASDLKDEKVTGLAEKLLRGAPKDKAKRAELLRQGVYEHISDKNLSTALATASEVVRTRSGDCSEHGVLLAALLRADKIPSRVATGVIYADSFAGQRQIFGYHMWAQALLDTGDGPRWVDLDATFPPELVFDATHITIAHYDLGDSTMNQSLVNLARVLGRLQVKVESVEHGNTDHNSKDGK